MRQRGKAILFTLLLVVALGAVVPTSAYALETCDDGSASNADIQSLGTSDVAQIEQTKMLDEAPQSSAYSIDDELETVAGDVLPSDAVQQASAQQEDGKAEKRGELFAATAAETETGNRPGGNGENDSPTAAEGNSPAADEGDDPLDSVGDDPPTDEGDDPPADEMPESLYDPVARVATGESYEMVRMQRIENADCIILPSYASLGELSISWYDELVELGVLAYTSSVRDGLYSNGVLNATACETDANGARLVYVRAASSGVTHVLRVFKSSGVRTLFLVSDDPLSNGRAYIEASSDHSAQATGAMTLVDPTGSIVVQDATLSQIKGRGNSTWAPDKKPYQIKLEEKASLLDGSSANKAKTWVLLANAYDDTLFRNFVAQKTALAAGLTATPDCEYVDLYYDGEYRGLYLLSEKVQIAKGRVEISEIDDSALVDCPSAMAINSYGYLFRYVDDQTSPSTSDTTGGFLIELDNANYGKERCYFNTSVGYFVIKSPENATKAQVKYISEYVQAAIDTASIADGNAAKYFDLVSLARYFLVNELAKNTDYMRYSSTFFYRDAGSDVLHAGPVWDFDLSFGVHAYEGHAEYIDIVGITNPEAMFFAKNKQFRNAVKQALSNGFLNQAKRWVGSGPNSLIGMAGSMSSAIALDELMWAKYKLDSSIVVKFDTYAESREYLVDWLKGRISWMEAELVSSIDSLCSQPPYSPDSPADVVRISGDSALDTMSAVVDAGNFKKNSFVILVTSDGYWDALTASGIAGMVHAPIIMTPSTYLADQARAQLAKLKPKTIIICGGTTAIANSVAQEASKAAGAARIERCWGQTAVDTAIDIYSRAIELTGGQWATTAFICTNDGYWDALSAAPISYAMHMPILLTDGARSISKETLNALQQGGIRAVYIVGGTAAIAESVERAIKGVGIVVSGRLAGKTAVETSEEVAEFGLKRGMSANLMGAATTNGYWDALSGSALCGKNRSVIVLVNSPICHSIKVFMIMKSSYVRQAFIFGGSAAVSQATLEAVRRKLSGQM